MPRRRPADPARYEQIRELFDQEGGDIPMRRLAQRAIEEGIFARAEIAAYGLRQVMEECRRALNETDPITNLPHAQPLDEGDEEHGEDDDDEESVRGPRWRQLALFSADQAHGLLVRRSKYLHHDHARYASVWRYFDTRYPGQMPIFLDLAERHR
jgi:hypothetical protein